MLNIVKKQKIRSDIWRKVAKVGEDTAKEMKNGHWLFEIHFNL